MLWFNVVLTRGVVFGNIIAVCAPKTAFLDLIALSNAANAERN